jgi:hypothetical protein
VHIPNARLIEGGGESVSLIGGRDLACSIIGRDVIDGEDAKLPGIDRPARTNDVFPPSG